MQGAQNTGICSVWPRAPFARTARKIGEKWLKMEISSDTNDFERLPALTLCLKWILQSSACSMWCNEVTLQTSKKTEGRVGDFDQLLNQTTNLPRPVRLVPHDVSCGPPTFPRTTEELDRLRNRKATGEISTFPEVYKTWLSSLIDGLFWSIPL